MADHAQSSLGKAKERMLLLIPVYPDELSPSRISKILGMRREDVDKVLLSLPSSCLLAERNERGRKYLTFPDIEAKRRAIGNGYFIE